MNKKDIKTRLKENNSIRGGTFLLIKQLCLVNRGKFNPHTLLHMQQAISSP